MKLYKYKSILGSNREHALDLIINKRAYFCNADLLNDPFEIDVDIHRDRRIQAFANIMAEERNMDLESAMRITSDLYSTGDASEGDFPDLLAHNFKKRFYLFCMSRAPDIISLWSYYADNHQGVCIEMELNDNLEIGQIAPARIKGKDIVFNINYDDTHPSIVDSDNVTNDVLSIFTKKHHSWRQEMESRILYHNDEYADGYIGSLPDNAIRSIIFGIRCNPDEIKSMSRVIADKCPDVALRMAYKIPGHRRLLSRTI